MKTKNKKANFIIIIIVGLLLVLIFVMQLLIMALQQEEQQPNNIVVSTSGNSNNKQETTVKEIIENAGSEYIDMNEGVLLKIYANFKYDLYDEDGKSKKSYFIDIIDKIVDLKKETFYLIDNEKSIEIYVEYDKEKDSYTVKFNDMEDFYDETDGDTYIDLARTQIVQQNTFGVVEDKYAILQTRGMYYANSFIVTSEREELPNGYYYYPEEHIKAKLRGAKVVNLIYDKDFEDLITANVYVTTKLEDVVKRYPNPGFGSPSEGYLGYRSSSVYAFLYGDEVSIYPYNYKENEYFDEYLEEYCQSGDLDKLVSDFTTQWSNYFEFEYDQENQNLKLTFPSRGIAMDIHNNDSKGITIYNNYYLTDTVKKLIKDGKITLEPDKDLIFITEQNRRESMK